MAASEPLPSPYHFKGVGKETEAERHRSYPLFNCKTTYFIFMATTTNQPPFEQRVAEAILQGSLKGKAFEIGGEKYTVTEPTPATLMMVSAEVTKIPQVNANTDNVLHEILRTAKDTEVLGKIAAILIIGAKRIKEHRQKTVCLSSERLNFFKRITTSFKRKERTVEEIDWLSEYLLDNVTIKTLAELISVRLAEMQIGDFFGLTTSLSAVNIIKATKEVEETVHGE